MARYNSAMKLLWLVSAFTVLLVSGAVMAAPASKVARCPAGKGMVASSEANASRVGAEILRKGGNAVDAAVAVGFALAVTHPAAGNIGGGGFLVARMADGQAVALDFRERAPFGSYAGMYQDAQGNVIPRISLDGWRAVGTPGTVAGLWAAHKRFGKLPWRVLVSPAVKMARDGFVVSSSLAHSLKAEKRFAFYVESQRIFHNNGHFYKAGDIFRQPDLAATLQAIADKGQDGFYKGIVAEKLARAIGGGGGYVTLRDLRDYRAVFRQPIVGTYRGVYKIITMPPPSSGGVALMNLLGQMETFDPRQFPLHAPETVHRRVEAMQRAFADRAFYMGDPDFVRVPAGELAAKRYAKARASTIDDSRATPSREIREGDPFPVNESPQTTHYSTADGAGNCVSVTYTLNTGYGAAVVAQGTGVLLNNEMDDFAAKPGIPNGYGLIQSAKNAIAPGKRPLSSMTPTIVLKNGKPFLVLGSPGGPTIINSVFQTLINVVDYDLSLAGAVAHGRVHHQWLPDEIQSEPNAVSAEARRSLERLGHKFATPRSIGDVEAIMRDEKSHGWIGVSDGRTKDSLAVAQ